MNKELLKQIPAVDKLLSDEDIKKFSSEIAPQYIVEIIRKKLDEFRKEVIENQLPQVFDLDVPKYLKTIIVDELKSIVEPYFRYAINGLGVILHTGLGRAPLSPQLATVAYNIARNYSRLQIDDEGLRDDRYKKINKLLQVITGCEAGIIVNNNAGATFLILSALAKGKEVIVSRGQLIEIGGSFRLPEIMNLSGAILKEVGTTNRTHLKDYENAITENTAIIMRVHQSNFRILGFTHQVELEELVNLGRKYQIPVVDDLGSGALIDFSKYGLPKEPLVQESIKTGADLVCFSGDKLIGGPQCGFIIGKKVLIDKIKKHPLARTLRCDKFTNALCEATLKIFLKPEEIIIKEHGVTSILLKPISKIKKQANWLYRKLKGEFKNSLQVEVRAEQSEIGGGSLSTEQLPTYAVAIKPQAGSSVDLARKLRRYQVPIFGRLKDDWLLLDFRTIFEGEEKIIFQAFKEILGS
ncbi:MAG: L-seryl-tRNA(Sec) selenium transferase [candidate division WOR-3 bacterium]|nr:L-seryl-tRNA(Sec) selenium transferase [candidate division WOR-3 bacterium]